MFFLTRNYRGFQTILFSIIILDSLLL